MSEQALTSIGKGMGGEGRERPLFLGGGLLFAMAIIALGALLPEGSMAGVILFDRREGAIPAFPLTIACIEWLVFGLGMGEMARHAVRSGREKRQLHRGLLPEDEDVMLDARSLAPFTRKIKASAIRPFRLQRLLLRTIWQFQSGRSVSQAAGIMDASLELCQHELDLQYSLSRYIVWLLPTIGFIGTVWGLSRGLGTMAAAKVDPTKAAEFQEHLQHTTGELSVAFNTTLVALLLSSLLVFIMHLIQEEEERALNHAGQYCIDNLINKLYVPPEGQ